VLAGALGRDLLVVDLSKLVSKWLGETEKHLAEVFDAAEHAQAVLLFDEADALFGRRTQVSDAHDRYANLETAYLLYRIERFDGLAVLSTNLQRNLDPAFLRRLEFVIDFEEPGTAERAALWRCHLPAAAPLDEACRWTSWPRNFPVVAASSATPPWPRASSPRPKDPPSPARTSSTPSGASTTRRARLPGFPSGTPEP
jgi:ATP-dependent 26S proteasome regulatory subunit